MPALPPDSVSVIVKAAVARLKVLHQKVGAYSTQLQWGKITGGLDLGGPPIWIAGWHDTAATYCESRLSVNALSVAGQADSLHVTALS